MEACNLVGGTKGLWKRVVWQVVPKGLRKRVVW